MAVGTKDLMSEQLRGLDDDRLVDELKKAKEELFNLRFQSATGQLDNHGRLRAVKKDIARIYTEMRERELGIGSAPVSAPAVEEKADRRARRAAKKEKAVEAETDDEAVEDEAVEVEAVEVEADAETSAVDKPADEQAKETQA
ncbi:50S ribosomal protein L29 [Intrasporangium sp.]|uniref:50S ribosomal protein L29 n=1 Tax=Intrasporangium sp. TaxID=1925024 RepID=UPI002649706C|nr:50S ribosomal protein L29 [Intrasporangium sp.]